MGFGLVHAMQSNGPHYKFLTRPFRLENTLECYNLRGGQGGSTEVGEHRGRTWTQTENGINHIIALSDGGPAGANESVLHHLHKLIFHIHWWFSGIEKWMGCTRIERMIQQKNVTTLHLHYEMPLSSGSQANGTTKEQLWTTTGHLFTHEEDESSSTQDMAEATPLPIDIFPSSPKEGPLRDDLFLWTS